MCYFDILHIETVKMASCMICDDEVTKKNPIFVCVSCDIKVHRLCYGIKGQLENWKCSPCNANLEKRDSVKCKLCCKKSGPMKQTECGKWVHVICALFMSGVSFSNEETMEPIDLSKVSASMRNRTCAFCNTSKGYCTTCADKKCKVAFHITCAQDEKTLNEETTKNNRIAFNAYCKEHMVRTDSSRRLSSGSVKDVANEKRGKVSKTDTSKTGDWILSALESTPLNSQRKRSCK